MSGAETAPSMMYVLTSVQFGQNSRNHSRTVLEHKFIYGMIYIQMYIKGYFQYQLIVCVSILSSMNKHSYRSSLQYE